MKLKSAVPYILIGGLCAALFIPFIIADGQLFPFITGKGFTFRILTEILFSVWLIAMVWDASLRPRFSWIMGAVLVFGGAITLADILGVSFLRSFWSNYERMDGLVSLLHLFAYFFVASAVMNTRKRWMTFFNVSVVSSVCMAMYAFRQLSGAIPINQGGVRVDGTFGNATYLAVFMLFNIFISLILLAWTHRDKFSSSLGYRWGISAWYILALILQIVILYHTATRGVILGLIGGVFLTALLVAIFEKDRIAFRRVAIGILVVLVLTIGGFFMIRSTDFAKKSPTLGRFTSISVEEIKNQGRRYVWPMAIEGFKENPIFGWGQENFNYVFNKNYDPRMYSQEQWFDRAHNIVLDWLVAGGLLGLLSYLAIFVAFLWVLWRGNKFTMTEKALLTGLVSGYFFQNLFVFDNLVSYIYFFSLLAFVHSEHVQEKSEPKWISQFIQQKVWAKQVLPIVVVVVVAFVMYSWNIQPIRASRLVISAINFSNTTPDKSIADFEKLFSLNTFGSGEASEQLFSQFGRFAGLNSSDQTKQKFAALAVERLDAQVNKYPHDARYLLFAGSLRNRLNDFQGALAYLERAHTESPKKQSIMFEIGFSHLSAGDTKTALQYFKQAYDLAPEYMEARIIYAIGAIYSKNNALTQELLSGISLEELSKEERLIAAYSANGRMTDAVKLVEYRLKLEPQNPNLYFRLAAGQLSLGQRQLAVETLRKVLTFAPTYADQVEYYIKQIQAGKNP